MNTRTSMSQGKIAVITGMSYLDVDRIIATVVLAKALAAKHNTHVDISLGFTVKKDKLESIVSSQNLEIVESLSLANRILTIDNLLAEVKDIKWKQEANTLSLELINANGDRIDPSETKVQYTSGKYEQVFTIGVRSAKYLLRLLSNTKSEDLEEVTLNSIDVVNKKDPGFSADRFVEENVHSLSAAVFSYCQTQEIDLDRSLLTELLSGIYWKTNSLRNYYTTKSTILTTHRLIEKGANLKQAVSRIYGQLDSELQTVWSELSSNLKLEGTYTVSSASTKRDYEDLLNNTVLPVFLPQFFSNTTASITTLPLEEKKTLVLVSSLATEINLHKLLREYSPKGDDLQVKLVLEKTSEEAKQLVKQALSEQNKATNLPEQKQTKSENADTSVTESNATKSKDTAKEIKPSGSIFNSIMKETPKQTSKVSDSDPLSPANQDEFKNLAEQNGTEEDSGASMGNSLFGGFGGGNNGDPLPAAKS